MQSHELKIKAKLCDLWSVFKGLDTDWTRETFGALREIGDQLGYESRYSTKYGGIGEWLWDFVWIERDPKSKNIVAVPLVAESE
jgi:hypothetical protein